MARRRARPDGVSIPCSEFWLFRPVRDADLSGHVKGFNSLFGILAVQTMRGLTALVDQYGVSIPCSEFWLFRLQVVGAVWQNMAIHVSIPCSEFWLFRLSVKDIFSPFLPVLFQFPVRNSGCSDLLLPMIKPP